MKNTIRIASGQGYWGDWQEAPLLQVSSGPIDYLVMDYLAEITMSILQKQKSRNPELGYAKDFIPLMKNLLPDLIEKNVTVIANAGGVNPIACVKVIREIADNMGYKDLKIAAVYGDEITDQLDSLIKKGYPLKNMDTGVDLSEILDRVCSANVYFGAEPVVEA
ncbi:MAG: acyclic terpene utilization AtuA family protein, partial [Calditrichia bacterium]|nr:acyclic terpene utilization AtuA family protein [Calditrichia bacterium]